MCRDGLMLILWLEAVRLGVSGRFGGWSSARVGLLGAMPLLFGVDLLESLRLPVDFLLFLARPPLLFFEHSFHALRLGSFGKTALALLVLDFFLQAGSLGVHFPL